MYFGIPQVHPHEHLGPVLAFGPTGTGIDLEDGAQPVLFTAEHIEELQVFNGFDGFLVMGIDILFRGLIGFIKIIDHGEIIENCPCFIIGFGPSLDGFDVFQDFFCLFRVVPKTGLPGGFLLLFYLFKLFIDVKDTSLRPRYGRAGL
jgi:hypothetical protein